MSKATLTEIGLKPVSSEDGEHVKCVVIDAKLITPVCPLPRGSCTWKHRKTGLCTYSSAFDGNPPSAQTIAALVGEQAPSEAVVIRITDSIKSKFKGASNL